MTATAFILTALEDGRHLGSAVVCAEARFASVLWRGMDRPDRRFVPARQWLAVEYALRDTLEPGLLPADHPVVVALLPEDKRCGFVVQYFHRTPVADGPNVAVNLDALLRSLIPAQLSIEQEHE
jgi:hypothetical protein